MKAVLLMANNNRFEKAGVEYFLGRIRAIGYEVEIFKQLEDLNDALVLAVIFDGRGLGAEAAAALGYFAGIRQRSVKPKPLAVGLEIAGNSDQTLKEKTYLDHLAKTDTNLIGCLKDYLFFVNKKFK